MYHITTNAHGLSTEQRPDGKHVREVFVDDDLTCSASPPIVSIVLLDQPGGMPATISGGTITLHEVGKHLFRVEFLDGKSAHLHVLACERACLDRIPGLNHGLIVNPSADPKPPERTFAEQCMILRSLANNSDRFDGTAASFDRLGNLAQYGA